jgi:hypothetical protein
MILSIFAPESLLPQARALSGIFGLTPADYTDSFQSLTWGKDGVLYSVHQCPATDRIIAGLAALQAGTLELGWPDWYSGETTQPEVVEGEVSDWANIPAMAMAALATVGQEGGLILGLQDAQSLGTEHGLVPV